MRARPPQFTEQEFEDFRMRKAWLRPISEWLRFVGILSAEMSALSPTDPKARHRSEQQYAVLRGMLNRCSRLILADIKLAAEQAHGEVIVVLTRCICETAIVARWLMIQEDPSLFKRYVASSLRSDLELKKQILKNVADRGGAAQPIERRMLKSVDLCLELSQMSEQEVWDTKPMYDFNAICRDLELPPEGYIAFQRIGSHAVHGTWTDLLFHYLEEKGDVPLGPTEIGTPPDEKHLIVVALEVLSTVIEYVKFMVCEKTARIALLHLCETSQQEILRIFTEFSQNDFEAQDGV